MQELDDLAIGQKKKSPLVLIGKKTMLEIINHSELANLSLSQFFGSCNLLA